MTALGWLMLVLAAAALSALSFAVWRMWTLRHRYSTLDLGEMEACEPRLPAHKVISALQCLLSSTMPTADSLPTRSAAAAVAAAARSDAEPRHRRRQSMAPQPEQLLAGAARAVEALVAAWWDVHPHKGPQSAIDVVARAVSQLPAGQARDAALAAAAQLQAAHIDRSAGDPLRRVLRRWLNGAAPREVVGAASAAAFRKIAARVGPEMDYSSFEALCRAEAEDLGTALPPELPGLWESVCESPKSDLPSRYLALWSTDALAQWIEEEQGDGSDVLDALEGDGESTETKLAEWLISTRTNSALCPQRTSVPYHDMCQPLTGYFVASSHNTYLTGHQLWGESKAEMYATVLAAGAKCLEIDCWDGADGEPVVTHGHTACTKIPFGEVVAAIAEHAFVRSPYPVLLSLEVHTSESQQNRMAQLLQDILGDKLLPAVWGPSFDQMQFSPDALRGRVLCKGPAQFPSYGKSSARQSLHLQPGEWETDSHPSELSPKGSATPGSRSSPYCVPPVAEDPVSPTASMSRDLSGAVLAAAADGKGVSFASYGPDEGNSSGLPAMPSGVSAAPLPASFRLELSATSSRGSMRRIPSLPSPSFRSGREQRKKKKVSRAFSDVIALPTHRFACFQDAARQGDACVVQSFAEGQMLKFAEDPGQSAGLASASKRMLFRTYPAGSRVASDNYDPQAAWSMGVHMVALNYQSKSTPELRLNIGRFQDNGGCGYLLKPPPLREPALPYDAHSDRCELSVHVLRGYNMPCPTGVSTHCVSGDVYVSLRIHGFSLSGAHAHPLETAQRTCSSNLYVSPPSASVAFDSKHTLKTPSKSLATLCLQVWHTAAGALHDYEEMLAEAVLPLSCLRTGVRAVSLWSSRMDPLPGVLLCKFGEVQTETPLSDGLAVSGLVSPRAPCSPASRMSRGNSTIQSAM
eukprot:TRINITY_DN8119_c0_g1_i3.p1 TRINITY_DN8119_c0_g1~~TRINITY_DN8119_c0_g1_i3.p1  ORF type:complete len:920 (+),score=157.75 TRINITY_DN8119_c0_g1_i3:63-2822(+)